MSEKVLFELRIQSDDDGTRFEVMMSPEWEAYHHSHHDNWREKWRERQTDWRERRAKWASDDDSAPTARQRADAVADDLRNALDSLQTIYEDLYGDASASSA